MKLLIVGGSSALAEYLGILARSHKYEVTATFRSQETHSNFDSCAFLDLSSISSIEDFLSTHANAKFQRIIILTGSESGIGTNLESISKIESYYATHLVNTIYFLDKILDKLDLVGNLIYLSSIAAINSSFDCHYSAVKAGISAFIKSRSRFLEPNQSAFSVAPSLIEGTRMHDSMSSENLSVHKIRNKGKLASISEIGDFIWAQEPRATIAINGRQISVGNEY